MSSLLIRRIYKLFIGGIVVLALFNFGCGSKEDQVAPSKRQVLECAFPDSPTLEAPTWVCDFPMPGVQVSAVGSHKSSAGVSFTKDQAIADGRGKLAGQMRTHVRKMIKRYVETTGQGDTETVDAVFTSVGKNITKETLYGSRVYRSITNPDTRRIYVLVGFDAQMVTENARAAIKKAKDSMNSSAAAYQRNLSKEAMQELENETGNLNNQVGQTTAKSKQ